MTAERIILTVDEAIAMLSDGDTVHTFLNSSMFMVGADWSRDEVIEEFRRSPRIELSGEMATSMDHGICFWQGQTNKGRWVFVETKPAKKEGAT